jgi:PAS domain S-box-containing protein
MPESVDLKPAPARPTAAPGLDTATALALLQQGPSAIALCDALGQIEWCNRRLLDLAGGAPAEGRGQNLALLLGLSAADAQALHEALRQGRPGPLPDMQIGGFSGRWCRAQLSLLPDGRRATHWQSVEEQRLQAAEATRLAELLDLAQDFGRLGVWERDTQSLQGRWDRHMYRIWGLSENADTPDFERATQSVLDEDRAGLNQAFRQSIRRAGSYSHRYRVRGADGVVRQLHSQWVVKNGANGLPERVLGILVDDTEAWAQARSHAEATEQLRLALTLANIVVFRHDLRSDRISVSERAFELLGMPSACTELSAEELRAMVHPDDQAALRSSLEQAVGCDHPVDAETRFRHAGGDWRHVLTRRILLRDDEGRPAALLGVGLDLSERVESSRRHTELMRQFELTTRAAGIGYWSVEAETGQPRWSEQTFHLHGLPAGSSALSNADWLRRFVHPADRDAVRQRYLAWVKSGGPNLEQELRIVRSDGATRHMLSYSRLEGPPGRYDFFGVLMDVTERRAAEAALRSASERAGLATRGAGMGTWEQDLLTGQAQWDEQMWRLRGLSPRAQTLSEGERMALVHPDDREATLRELTEATHEGRPSYLEFRVRWPDGQWRLIASRSIAVRDEQDQPTRRIGINWDVTDTRAAQSAREEKLLAQRESQAKSEFLSRMSHELRTPLNAVLGFAQLMLGDGEKVSAETRRRRLEQIQVAGQHLLSLINDVLDLSSLEGGEVRISLQPVALPTLVAETLPLVARSARQRKVKLRSGALAGVALADATRLRQVLLNLLTNAVKYNREGGQVLVEAEQDGDSVLLRVSDTGRGMNESQLQHAFEPFNRLGVETEGIEGTGIGLAIVKALVERMGGTVQARSTPEQGSVFEVRLPDGAELGDGTAALPAHAAPPLLLSDPPSGRTGRLLYIEDNPVNLLIVQEVLAQRPDLQLDTAVDGLSGVSLAQSSQPDLILVDMQLPDIDGHEVLRRLRADAATAQIPCISLSANAMPDDIQRALQAGFADYWTKPLDLRRFLGQLETIFGAPG